ncbi:hypothetical protein [Limosilactobacillus caecicola]|uniref:hypothetical protein n=1 Tax=Limosilactobacillus caecicola TaxID=2941332 RepID=UPI00203FB014|nr:hypothetical protein [Limosilactobacillus caecicola]
MARMPSLTLTKTSADTATTATAANTTTATTKTESTKKSGNAFTNFFKGVGNFFKSLF